MRENVHFLYCVHAAGIEPLFYLHDAGSSCCITTQNGTFYWRSTTPTWQQREMEIDERNERDEWLFQNPPISNHHTGDANQRFLVVEMI